MNPLISILVPSFNQGKYIEKTILSVLNQTFGDWELIIHDSCSSDDTADICSKYTGRDPRIRFYREKDSGFADGVNRAIGKASGIIAAIQSSDDYYASETVFATVAEHFRMHPGLQLLTAGYRMVDDSYHFIDISSPARKLGFIDRLDAYRLLDHFPQGSTFFKLDRIRQIGGLDPRVDMVADTDLWVRLANQAPVASNALLRAEGIWSHLIMHPQQRTADQTKFHMGRTKMYISYYGRVDMDVPAPVKAAAVIGHLTDTFHYFLYKKKPTAEIEDVYRKHLHKKIPISWRVKKILFRIPLMYQFYFSNFKDNDTGTLLDSARGDYSIWFETTDTDKSRRVGTISNTHTS